MNKELDFIQTMFDSIAPKYDFLNRFLSLRQDVFWRKEMVKAANLAKDDLALDVACGTGDFAITAKKILTPFGAVWKGRILYYAP